MAKITDEVLVPLSEDLIQIQLGHKVNPKVAERLHRLGGQSAVDDLVEDIRAAMQRFTDDVLKIQAEHRERLDEKLAQNVVRFHR